MNRIVVKGHELALESVPCDFCRGRDFVPFFSKMRHGVNLPTVFCRSCGLCQTNPRPTPESSKLFYSTLYNSFHKRDDSFSESSEYVVRSRRLAERRVDLIGKFVPMDASATVFEIGAGVGQFQLAARTRTRWNLRGIEPGRGQFGYCQQLGLNVENRFLEELSDDVGGFDVVVSFHVFEHSDSPAAFLRRAMRLVKPGGLVVLEVPNLARSGGPTLGSFFQFPHLYSFTAQTLRNYLSCIGNTRVLYVAERMHDLFMIARKQGEPSEQVPGPGEYELFDVDNFIQRLRMQERVYQLAARIPDLPILRKVAGTLRGV
jgi:2-polyprenyl-3-methyl-5-hydroxy-6-metoxy-1,4-benzoquinol methylase